MKEVAEELQAPRRSGRLIFYLGVLNALTPFSIDLYLPAFSDIASDLRTSVPRVSLSVASYFVGYAVGQIFYGPLLDTFGRKTPLLAGLFLYILATLGCLGARSVEALIIFRFLQALGGAASSVGAITMVRDYFPPDQGARVFSMLMLVLSASPFFAPSIGAFLALHFGWRLIFAVLLLLALVNVGIVTVGLPRGYRPEPGARLKARRVLDSFAEVFRVRRFRVATFAGSLSFAGLFVYLTGSPSIFVDGFQVSKQTYGLIFALLAVGMIGGGQLNNFLIRRSSSARVLGQAIFWQVVASLIFLVGLLTVGYGLASTIVLLFFILLCAGIGYPNAAAVALAPFSKNAGTASSLMGFLQMGLGALLASLVGLFDVKGSLPTALVMAFSSLLGWLVLKRGQEALSS